MNKLGGVQVLIFDEVDRLLDGGFARDINKLLDALPKNKPRYDHISTFLSKCKFLTTWLIQTDADVFSDRR